ncbi:DNA mismatch repair protein MutS [Ornatilinea apprima]|uniref:DNA mismatch repair protein MutS n=1 Tax=Ornatilinea apprima TaxID=1134406 RepID=A0A0P6X358_9CHLR|nr:DNA mismatch repair protein MutS [Ornatilinea apprima]KPL77265.1 DNA mismatch repair protein MutS [Ornatilinea apprima]
MTFQSILFEQQPDHTQIGSAIMPPYFPDLNLDQVIDAIVFGRREYNLRPFFYSPLKDVETVRYRQEVARDLENNSVFESIKTFAEKMIMMRRYLGLVEKLEFHYHREGWFLEAALVYCEAVSDLAEDLSRAPIKSRGFIAFREYLNNYVHSPYYHTLRTETEQRKAALSTIRYTLIIKDRKIIVRRYQSEINYSREVERTFEKFKQGAVKDYRSKLRKASGMNHVEGQILDYVARLHPEPFADLDQYCKMHQNFLDETIRVFDQEVQFYVAYLEFIQKIKLAGLKFCYPEVSAVSKEISEVDGFDIALANKLTGENAAVICNDIFLTGKERIIIVSGPNQGGKTTFARMFGQIHYLGSLGLPVPGRHARLFLFDNLFTHFEKEENIQNLRGKLQDDLVRMHKILKQATPASIVIMNEVFTSTTLKDAVYLSNKVMEKIIQLDLLCVCVTFLDELASLNGKTVSMVSTIVPKNPALRTFKVIRRRADGLAYALNIAEKYHLTHDLLKERIKR